MHDRLSIYRDSQNEWRWRRIALNGNIIAESGEGYSRRIDCDRIALRVNAQPYIVEVEGEVVVEIDVDQEEKFSGITRPITELADGSAFAGTVEEAIAAGLEPRGIGTAELGEAGTLEERGSSGDGA
jgi:uncharacterized protein YegP (UPF0339 family)